jgi:hypothetical protein
MVLEANRGPGPWHPTVMKLITLLTARTNPRFSNMGNLAFHNAA